MGLKIERVGSVVIVVPKGFYKGDRETDELDAKLGELISTGERKILLDLAQTEHMTSIPIGLLTRRHVTAQKRGIIFCMCNITDRIQDVLLILMLARIFTIYETREQALQVILE